MRIEVTQDDIDHGVRRECDRCPIARALKRATGEAWDVGESNDHQATTCRRGGDRAKWLKLPDEATNFMFAFDNGFPVWPFSFEFDPDQQPDMETPPLPTIVYETKSIVYDTA